MKTDYEKKFQELTASIGGARPRLLLHSCCAPCTSSVLERVHPWFDVTLYYFNPNTHPRQEYEKRGAELPKLLRAGGYGDVKILWGEYEPETFFAAASGLESEPEGGARCEKCFELRLAATAKLAAEGAYDFFGTTLTVSPHKNAALINEIGHRLAGERGPAWLWSDFKKKDGYLRSIRLSREYGLYRQCFCGCVFSTG